MLRLRRDACYLFPCRFKERHKNAFPYHMSPPPICTDCSIRFINLTWKYVCQENWYVFSTQHSDQEVVGEYEQKACTKLDPKIFVADQVNYLIEKLLKIHSLGA